MALKIIAAWLAFCACSCGFIASAKGPVPEPISEECTSGFIPLDMLTALSRRIITRDRQQRIIPDINFTCDGVITKWIVGARWDGNDWFPDLQLWRETGNRTYTNVGNTTLRVGNESTSRVYEYPVDPPLEFQAGDILGIFQPHQDESRIQVDYEEGSGPPNYYIRFRDDDKVVEPPLEEFTITDDTRVQYDTPLIAVETSNPQCECGFGSKERILFQKQRELTRQIFNN